MSFIGYENSLKTKDKFTYIINASSLFLVFLFSIFFIVLVKHVWINSITLLCFTILSLVFVLLKKKRYRLAKIFLISGFLFQECTLVFLWFPVEANFNYFFFIVTPISFFIYDFEIKEERTPIVIVNLLAVLLLFASETIPMAAPQVSLSENLLLLFSGLSVISTLGSIFIVYYFYARNLSMSRRELSRLAETDYLTGTFNRRILYREGEALFSYCKKKSYNFAFIIFDIDHFKKVNDQYGHPAGDEILIQLTRLISANIRHSDVFGRYGGEEFALILKEILTETNIDVAQNLRRIIEDNVFIISENLKVKITVSMGVASFSEDQKTFDDIVILADNALYKAKENGRNRVEISPV